MAKRYDVFLGKKKVRSCLSDKDSRMVAESLRGGQAIKKLRGMKTQSVRRVKCVR